MKKRLAAATLAASVIFSLGTTAFADGPVVLTDDVSVENEEEVKTSGNYQYIVNDQNQVILIKYTGNEENVVTPTMIEGKSVVGIRHYVFEDVTSLKTLTISEGIQFAEGTIATYNWKLEEISLPSTLDLTNSGKVFDTCLNLKKITVAKNNPYLCMENNILYTKDKKQVIGCAPKAELGDVVLPESVTFIRDDAFANNETLTSIQIPDGVTTIGYWAFSQCENLEKVNIPRSLEFMGQYAFQLTNLKSIWIPKEVKNCGIVGDRFGWTELEEIAVENGNDYYKVIDGALIHENALLMYAGGRKETSYRFPDNIETIGWWAFGEAKNLKTIILSDKLTEIPYAAFYECEGLEEIKIPSNVKWISDSAFFNCYSLQKIYLPESLTKIGDYVFTNVESIADIYYGGTQEQWEKISKGNSFDRITPTYHFNYDACTESGHSYGEPIYEWSEDCSKVTAKRICQTNEKHVEEETVSTTVAETKQPTCSKKGSTTYAAAFENAAFVKQTKAVDGAPALGHDFKDGVCTRCKITNIGKWIKSGNRWWYRYSDGSYPKNEICQIGKSWYCFDAQGWMQTGWLLEKGTWYYLNTDGTMAKGWKYVNKVWYYFQKSGAMQTGWLTESGSRYYLNADGKMETGLLTVEDANYYFNASGKMQTGWQKLNGIWYYFKADGKMAVNGWQKIGGKWYYMDKNGAMQESRWISGIYYVKADGSMAVSEWVDQDRYYVDANGKWVKDKVKEA